MIIMIALHMNRSLCLIAWEWIHKIQYKAAINTWLSYILIRAIIE